MCHSLAFDRIGGTIRTLRHGEPAQVVADLRALLPRRRAAAGRPSSAPARAAGRATSPRSAPRVQFARARAGIGGRAERAIRAVFSPGGACFDCHQIVQPPPRHARLPDPPGRLPGPLHAARLVRSPRPPDRAAAGPAAARRLGRLPQLPRAPTLDQRRRPAAARSRQLPHLPWRRSRPGCRCRRPARCATITIWTRARRRCCSASACAGGAGRRRVIPVRPRRAARGR